MVGENDSLPPEHLFAKQQFYDNPKSQGPLSVTSFVDVQPPLISKPS